MPITSEGKRLAQAIVGVFETGKAGGGDAGSASVLRDRAGISYGLHQATDRSGSLDAIVLEYADRGGLFASELLVYLPRLARDESVTSAEPWVDDLVQLLGRAGREDPVMLAAQQAVFDRLYWVPMALQAESMRLQHPLSWAVCYDTAIQSGPAAITTIRRAFAALPPARGGAETAWVFAYLDAREAWLSGFTSSDVDRQALVRSTVYRVRSLRALAKAGRWDLAAPVSVQLGRGQVVLR